MAQLVNALACIRTENGGPAWRQATYYPFLHASRYGRGEVLHTVVRSSAYANAKHGDVPYLDAVATVDRPAAALTLFYVNRSSAEGIELAGRLGRFPGCRLVEHIALTHADRRAANTRDTPLNVVPRVIDATRVDGETFSSVLPPLSWNVIRFRYDGRE